MSALVDPHNTVKRAIDRRAARVPRRRRRVYTAAAYETAQVESGFRDLPGGDADSYGFRQQRESIYGRQNLTKQVDNLFRELGAVDRGQPSYELAAEVQRPAAQYRGRYRQAQPDALKLLSHASVPGRSSSAVPASSLNATVPATRSTTTIDNAAYEMAVRRQKVATLLSHAGHGSSVLFKSGLLSTKPVDPVDFQTTSSSTVPTSSSTPGTRPGGTPSSSDVHAALTAAKKRLGVHEDNGTNRSPAVDQLEKGFGMVAQPWCGIFVGTALREAGVKGVDSRVTSVAEIETMARNHDGAFAGGFHSAAHARAGDALITRQGQHVALVTHVDPDGTIHTIGGNQGDGRVTRGAWKPDQVYGVARPHYRHS